MEVTKASKVACDYACLHYHYSQCTPVIGRAYNIWNDSHEWCGVIIYGPGANCNLAKPYHKYQGQVLELVRVALNGRQGHGRTSEALSLTLKALAKEMPCVDLVVSYADKDQNHAGVLYQSTNWIYTGVTADGNAGAVIINGKKLTQKVYILKVGSSQLNG